MSTTEDTSVYTATPRFAAAYPALYERLLEGDAEAIQAYIAFVQGRPVEVPQ